jgi:hypothetical protein
MKHAHLVRIALLALVAGSVAVWAAKSLRDSAADASAAAVSSLPADAVAVVNFHGTVRCPTCRKIGALAEQVVATDFAAEVERGRVAWLSLDFDLPENLHFKDAYDLVTSNVVAVRRSGGTDVAWRRLDDVWDLYDDEPAFRAYVEAAIDDLLAERAP